MTSKKKISRKKSPAKSQKDSIPSFLSGNFLYEDQHRFALIKVGTKLIHVVSLYDTGLRCIIGPKSDLRYLREEANSETNLPLLKKRARQLSRKSPLTGLKREMTVKARGVLDEILNL